MSRTVSDGDYVGVRSRLLVIDAAIRRGNYPNQTSLSKQCGVSTKTIQRDLAYLQFNMSAPLEYDPVRRGYFYSTQGFFLPLIFASGAEFQAIQVIGELVAQYQGSALGDMMDRALHRILSVFKNEDVDAVRHLAERICFAAPPAVAVDRGVWDNVLIALQRDQSMMIGYRKGGQDAAIDRKFDPYGLIVRNRDWFLYGFCHLHKERATLFLPYASRAHLLDEFFDLPRDFNLRDYAKTGFQGLHAEREQNLKVVLRFVPASAGAVSLYRFAHDQTCKIEPSGHAVVTFRASAMFQVEREVLSWGEKVEVLAPPILRERIQNQARGMLQYYKRQQ